MSRILVNELGARTGTDISIKSGSTLGGADSQLKITGGSSGQVLTTNGLGVLTWTTIGGLPTQSGQSGKFLTTDGTDTSWSTITHPTELPTQTSQSGKYLTTNGTIVSWATVDALPSQTSQAGEFLTTDGTNASWEPIVINPYDTATASTGYFDLPAGTFD